MGQVNMYIPMNVYVYASLNLIKYLKRQKYIFIHSCIPVLTKYFNDKTLTFY